MIRDPTTKIVLGAEGRLVDMTNFWNRRVLDGTVEIVKSLQKKDSHRDSGKKEDDK